MPLPELAVVLLAWRERPEDLDAHHRLLAAALPAGWDGTALVVDNGATPATARAAVALARRHHPAARHAVLRLGRNRGFARAMDLALDAVDAEVVLLLNADTRPAPGMVTTLAAALADDPGAVWGAPAVAEPGVPAPPPGPPRGVEELSGMALLIRRAPFLALGGFDPLFFFYNEDFDASARLRAAGARLLLVPDARLEHAKDARAGRARLLRERHFAVTDQARVWASAGTRRQAVARLARGRLRALAEHAGDPWALAGLAAATALLPWTVRDAEPRRRRPWDGEQLAAWLDRARPGTVLEAPGADEGRAPGV